MNTASVCSASKVEHPVALSRMMRSRCLATTKRPSRTCRAANARPPSSCRDHAAPASAEPRPPSPLGGPRGIFTDSFHLAKNSALGPTLGTVGPGQGMHARKPPPTLDQCVITSARISAVARDRLAKLQFTVDAMLCRIEQSAEVIEASQALLAKLQNGKISSETLPAGSDQSPTQPPAASAAAMR
jgi:hypothetical protein